MYKHGIYEVYTSSSEGEIEIAKIDVRNLFSEVDWASYPEKYRYRLITYLAEIAAQAFHRQPSHNFGWREL